MSTSIYSNHTINFTNAAIRKKLLSIETFAKKHFFKKESTFLSAIQIAEIFGQQNKDTAKELVKLLLIRDKSQSKIYLPGVRPLSYWFNWNNLAVCFNRARIIEDSSFNLLYSLNTLQEHNENKRAKEIFDFRWLCKNDKLGEGMIEYIEQESGRLYSPFQNCSKKARKQFYSKWHDYDIEAAAYCLTHEHYKNVVIPRFGKFENYNEPFKVIPLVYKEKNRIRNHFSKELGISVDLVKAMLQSVLFNANFYENPFSGFYDQLVKNGHDPVDFYEKCKNSILLQSLIDEVQIMWPRLFLYYNNSNEISGFKKYRKEIEKDGEIKSRLAKASFRAAIYFQLERKVLNEVILFLDERMTSFDYRLIHDGFFCKDKIDLTELEARIKDKLNFEVKYSYEEFF